MADKPGPSSRSLYFNRSKTHENYFRLCGLITTICSELLRVVLGHYIKPAELRLKLDANRTKLEGLKLLNRAQKEQIYQTAGKALLSVDDLDISVLYILLRNICNIPKHNNGWGNSPQKGDNCIAACIERIRLQRNLISAHSPNGKVEETEFKKHWQELRDVIEEVEKQISGTKIFTRGVDFLLTCKLSGEDAEKYELNFKKLEDVGEKMPLSQPSDKASDGKGGKKPRCPENVLVAAIDFGTAYSGHAFSPKGFNNDPLRITAHKWSSSLLSRKTPTNALFDKDGTLIAFGYEAEEQFRKFSEEGEHVEYYFFQKFKMQLYDKGENKEEKRLTETSLIHDINGKVMTAMYVFSASIKYMHDHLLKELKNQDGEIQEEEIHWVLTVPAIWDDSAKQFMRDAAEQAGIKRESLTIALEPEAASMYCKNIPLVQLTNKEFDIFSKGNQYLILDAGGGTVDIAIHEVLDGGSIKEIHKATGGAWGGTYINDKLFEILEDIFGKDGFENFKKNDLAGYIDLCEKLELSKRDINTKSTKLSLQVPPQLKDALKISKSKFAEKFECNGKRLELKESLIKEWFSDICNSIVDHVRKLLDKQKIENIIMVGGFSESHFLQETMKLAFSDKCIVVPNEASLAVLKGAVLFGHDPSQIVSRVAKFTYGVDTLIPVVDEQSISDKKRIQTIDGVKYEMDVFHKHVTKGDTLKIGEAQHEKAYSPVYKEQNSIRFFIYSSPREDPKYVDESDCNYLGFITVDIPNIREGLDRRVLVRFIFGGTEIRVEGVNEETKKVTCCTFTSSDDPEKDKKNFYMPTPS